MHRILLAAGLLWLACAALPAAAQHSRPSQPILFSADELQSDEALGLVIAKGHVQISQGQQILLADTVTYNQKTDTITAAGHVSLSEPTGDILFADFLELHDHFNDGFLTDLRMLLSDRSRLAGNTARRTGGTHLELRRGVYSPCDLCASDPTRPPLWQLSASEIIHDRDTHTIEYYDTTVDIDGVPILYTPYLSHPDPSVKRQSGFLVPSIGDSSNLGLHFDMPYYWDIGPDRDATITPILTTQAGDVLDGAYRQRFSNGQLQVTGSVDFIPAGETFGAYTGTGITTTGNQVQGHLIADGQWDLNENWRTGFDLQRETNQTYMQLFNFGAYANFLTSQAYAERFTQNSYLGIYSYAFQTLRYGTNDVTQPLVTPVVDYNWVSGPDQLGGHWDVNGNMMNLDRLQGSGSHRVSLGTGWTLPFSSSLGDLYTLDLTMRGDSYYATNFQETPGGPAVNVATERLYPQASLKWDYPWVRRGTHDTETIEPIAMLVASPLGLNPASIPNEDSLTFDFSDADLFVPNRYPGLDLVDIGDRVDYGLSASVNGDGGGSTSMLIGQSRRLQQNVGFQQFSGLQDRISDIVGRVIVSPNAYFSTYYHFRFNHQDLASEEQIVGFSGGPDSVRLNLELASLPPDPITGDLYRRDQINASLTASMTRYWTVSLSTTQNLTGPTGVAATPLPQIPLAFATQQYLASNTANLGTVSTGLVLAYRDECLSFLASIIQTGYTDQNIRPGTAVVFTVVFKNLGELSEPVLSTSNVSSF